MSAFRFTSAQQRKNQTVSTKQSLPAPNTAEEAGKESASSTSGVQAGPTPRSETPKMVRSRPKLPSGLTDGENCGAADQQHVTTAEKNQNNNAGKNRAGHNELDKLVGILNVLGTTDFVRKYSRKGRSATSSPAIPLSPTPSDLTSPGAEKCSSPPPGGKRSGSATPTRLRSIRVRLEKVKEDRDKQAEMERVLAKYTKHRKTQVISSHDDGETSQDSKQNSSADGDADNVLATSFSSDVFSDCCSDQSSVIGGSVVSPLTSSEQSVSQTSDSVSQTDDLSSKNKPDRCVSNTTKRSNCDSMKNKNGNYDLDMSTSKASNGDDASQNSNEDFKNNNSDPDLPETQKALAIPTIKTPSESSLEQLPKTKDMHTHTDLISEKSNLTETLPSQPLTVSGDTLSSKQSTSLCLTPDSMRHLSEGPDDVFLSPVKKTVDDEGYIEESDLNLSMDSDVCSVALSDTTSNKQSGSDIPAEKSVKNSQTCQVRRISDLKNDVSEKGSSAQHKGNRSSNGVKMANGRFLTHPPSSDRNVQFETGVVDSYGFSPLSRDKTGNLESESPPKDSQVSLADSQIAPSEASDLISADSLEHLERRNGKSLKQKSKSDPCGQKNSGYVDLPKVISTHASSVPILTTNAAESSNEAKATRKSDSDASASNTADITNISLRQKVLHKKSITKEVSTQTKDENSIPHKTCDKTLKTHHTQDPATCNVPSARPKLCTPQGSIDSDPRSDAESTPGREDKGRENEPLRPPERPKRRQRLAASAALKKQMPKAKSLEEPSSVKEMHSLNSTSMTNMSKKPPDGRLSISEKSSPITERPPSFPNSPTAHSKGGLSLSEKASPTTEGSSFLPPSSENKSHLSVAYTRPESFTLTLPSLRKTNITRSHSSASMIQHKLANSKVKTSTEGPAVEPMKSGISEPELVSPTSHKTSGFTPTLEPISQSYTNLCERSLGDKEKRDFIITELYNTEKQYVQALQMLVEKYMVPLKTQGIVDSNIVDDIFYKINEIYVHHATFLSFLQSACQKWDGSKTVGDIIYKTFSKQTVIESYVSFIINFPKAEKVLDAMSSKSAFQKFIEQIERETRSKLPLKAQVVKPAQRIPRYELLLKRLLDNTNEDHPDHSLLQQAEKAIHQLALKINSVKAAKKEDVFQNTLKKLELLLITDLVSPDRLYVRHEQVQVLNRKDQCCMWLFSDLLVLSSMKRKTGPVSRKTSLLLHSPTGNDFVENNKQKLWLRVPLDEVEIIEFSGSDTLPRRHMAERPDHNLAILEEDFSVLSQMADLAAKLHCSHQTLDDGIQELLTDINKKLSEVQLKPLPPDATRMHLMVTTPEGVKSVILVFTTAEKKSMWATLIEETRNKLICQTDSRPPDFVQALQITKTRAGMQFSCAAPIDSLTSSQQRDVWVCNSDGYVGHMCLLSLQPEPIVTINTPVPGCSARILCICAVPAYYSESSRFSRRLSRRFLKSPLEPLISPQPDDINNANACDSSDSSDSDSEDETSKTKIRSDSTVDAPVINLENHKDSPTLSPPTSTACLPSGESEVSLPPGGEMTSSMEGRIKDTTNTASVSPYSGTMWLGTEDGCILIFQSTDNIKTTRNKLKVKHSSAVLNIMHFEQKVFVSLASGEIVIYATDKEGHWNVNETQTVSVGSASAPISRMLAVAGAIWCSKQTEILVFNPQTLQVDHTFTGNVEKERSIQCMVSSGLGVWISAQGSAKVLLFHAKSHQLLLEFSVAQVVAQKLQTADDIIRQHKSACLRITSLLTCKDLLWVGTSAGVILTVPIPKILSSTSPGSLDMPVITGLPFGHTGHVRFLTSIEVPVIPTSPNSDSPGSVGRGIYRRISAHSRATRLLVISGGDGYEDFRGTTSGDSIGKDDSTNHLLLWEV